MSYDSKAASGWENRKPLRSPLLACSVLGVAYLTRDGLACLRG
jgi:hypothetical protein